MKCIDPAIGKYILGVDTLEDSELRQAVERHLRECQYCRQAGTAYDARVTAGRHELANHPDAEALAAFTAEPAGREESLRVGRHLLICSSCRELMTELSSANEVLAAFEAGEELPLPKGWNDQRELKLLERLQSALPEARFRAISGNTFPSPSTATQRPASVRRRLSAFLVSLVTSKRKVSGEESGYFHGRRLSYAKLSLATLLLLLVFSGVGFLLLRRGQPDKLVKGNGTPVPQVSPSANPTPDITNSTPPRNLRQVEDKERTLTDGHAVLAIDDEKNLSGPSLNALPPKLRQQVEAAWRSQSFETPDLKALDGAKIETMGEGAEGEHFRLLSPVHQVVRSQFPIFRWEGLKKAQSYFVTVSDADSYEVIVADAPTNMNSWKSIRSLPRGHNYVWQVTAFVSGKKVTMPTSGQSEVKFRILEQALEYELQRAERASPQSPLALGVLYARAGLYHEALSQLQRFVAANPQSKTADRLLSIVKQKLSQQKDQQ